MSRERTRRRGLMVGLTAASLGVVYGYDLSNIAGVLANAIGRRRSMLLVGRWPGHLPTVVGAQSWS